jgi:cell division protein FtsX
MVWIEKQRNILGFTLASLLRRKRKNVALLGVYALVLFLLASAMFLTQAIKREASVALSNAPDVLVQRLTAGRHDLIPLSYMESIRTIRGVEVVESRLWGSSRERLSGETYTVVADPAVAPGRVMAGKGKGGKDGTITLRCDDGQLLSLNVAEMPHRAGTVMGPGVLLVSEPDFRTLFAVPAGMATDLALRIRNNRELATIAEKIVRLLPDTRPVLREEILRTYDGVFDWRGGTVMALLLGPVLAFILFAWDKAAGLSAEERREIGLLKALGWETSDVLLMKFWEGTVVSLAAFSIGVLLAWLYLHSGASFLFDSALKGWSVLYPSFSPDPAIDVYQVATLFFLIVAPYTAATIIPSWRAATVDPDSVMRAP